MTIDLAKVAKDTKIKYFLISYVDLFGGLRAKLVPAAAIEGMQKDGAGFAGFATWLDMTPADSDLFAKPDPASLIQLPWKPEVGWLAADLWMDGKEVAASPRKMLKDQIAAAAAKGYRMKSGVECEYFLITPDGKAISDPADTQEKPCYDQQALMRRYDVITEICDSMLTLGLEALSERPRGRERPVRNELGIRRLPPHRRPPRLLQVHGQGDRREARLPRHLHAEAVHEPDRQRLPRPCLGLGQDRARRTCSTIPRASSASPSWPIISSAASSTTPTRCARSSIRR